MIHGRALRGVCYVNQADVVYIEACRSVSYIPLATAYPEVYIPFAFWQKKGYNSLLLDFWQRLVFLDESRVTPDTVPCT